MFESGETEEVDVIILATGFNIDIPFLPASLMEELRCQFPMGEDLALYQHTLVPGDETLAFVGMRHFIGSAIPCLEMQARYTALVMTGKVPRPSQAKMLAGVEAWKIARALPGKQGTLSCEVQEDIADELGISPSRMQILCRFRELVASEQYACFYRTSTKYDDPQTAQKASDRLKRYFDEPCLANV